MAQQLKNSIQALALKINLFETVEFKYKGLSTRYSVTHILKILLLLEKLEKQKLSNKQLMDYQEELNQLHKEFFDKLDKPENQMKWIVGISVLEQNNVIIKDKDNGTHFF